MNDICAIVLAAGQSSRFYPYNNFGHKSLITLLGKTLISRTLSSLRDLGIKKVVIVQDLKKSVEKNLTSEDLKNLDITFVIQKDPKGMGDALLSAEKFLDNTFFVLSAYHFDFADFANDLISAKKKDSDLVLLTQEGEDSSQFGAIEKKEGRMIIREKEKENKKFKTKIIGIYLLNKNFVQTLKNIKKSHYDFEDALSKYSEENELVLVDTKKPTLSVKFPWDLLTVKDYLLANLGTKISKKAKVSKSAILKGEGIVVEDGARILDGAVINGPAYIGKKAYIGSNSVLRDGVSVEEGAIVGGYMEVKDSIIMKHSTTHSGFIGNSVVGENSKVAASFVTANVRLDRQDIKSIVKGEKIGTHRKYLGVFIGSNVSCGINVGTMPGVTIGNNVIIGPGTTIMENIPDDIAYYTEFNKIVQKKEE